MQPRPTRTRKHSRTRLGRETRWTLLWPPEGAGDGGRLRPSLGGLLLGELAVHLGLGAALLVGGVLIDFAKHVVVRLARRGRQRALVAVARFRLAPGRLGAQALHRLGRLENRVGVERLAPLEGEW